MSSWDSIQEEIVNLSLTRPDAIDVIRRQKMKDVQNITGRPLIVYATGNLTILGFLFLAILIIVLPLTAFISQQHAAGGNLPSIGGCQIFPSDSVFNYDISNLPVHPLSTTYITTVGSTWQLNAYFNHPGVGSDGFPYNIVPGTQPYVPIHFTLYGSESDPGPYPIPSHALVERPTDYHVLVVDSGNCKLYELWAGARQPDGSWNAGSGAVFDLKSNHLRPDHWASADAAGLPILPLLIRYNEVAAGAINHPIRFLLPSNIQHNYVWPARHTDGWIPSNTNAPPEGIRLRLKSSVDTSSFPPQSRIILTALKHYGMFLADRDGGGNNGLIQIAGVPDNRWDMKDLANLNKIRFSDFEVVDESGLQVSPNSAQIKTNA